MRLSRTDQAQRGARIMKPIEFENGEVQIDACIVADGLGGDAAPCSSKGCAPVSITKALPSAGSMRIKAAIA